MFHEFWPSFVKMSRLELYLFKICLWRTVRIIRVEETHVQIRKTRKTQ